MQTSPLVPHIGVKILNKQSCHGKSMKQVGYVHCFHPVMFGNGSKLASSGYVARTLVLHALLCVGIIHRPTTSFKERNDVECTSCCASKVHGTFLACEGRIFLTPVVLCFHPRILARPCLALCWPHGFARPCSSRCFLGLGWSIGWWSRDT